MIMKLKFTVLTVVTAILFSCGGNTPTTENTTTEPVVENAVPADPMSNKGIGPVTNLELGAVDDNMVAEGLKIFTEKCTACHKVGKRYIGPDVTGVVKRRSPEWIMNMILNPNEMVANDPIAKDLLKEYTAPMANQSLKEEEARKILEYFRTI